MDRLEVSSLWDGGTKLDKWWQRLCTAFCLVDCLQEQMAAYEQPGLQDELSHEAERRDICHCIPLHLCSIPSPPDSASVSERHIVTFCFQELPLSTQRENEKWTRTSRTMGTRKTSMTAYSKWGSLGTRVWGKNKLLDHFTMSST